jgi:uncharacterized integral membrane protein
MSAATAFVPLKSLLERYRSGLGASMSRLLFIMLATVGLVLFALANTEHVELSFIVGQTRIRLIFLLMMSFTTGGLSAIVYQAVVAARGRRSRKRQTRLVVRRVDVEEGDAE